MEKTIQNLSKAFVWESQAQNRYKIYAKIAKKEWYEQISDIFMLTAQQEQEHAKWLFRMLNTLLEKKWEKFKTVSIETEVPTTLWNTVDNLQAAINWENYEYTNMYPEFAKIAEEEWLNDIAKRLRAIAVAESNHETRYKKLLEKIVDKNIDKTEEEVVWVCKKCWYVHKWKTPPEKCPSCDHPKNYFSYECLL